MINLKYFKSEETDEFNKFVKTHPPLEKGLWIVNTGITLMYDDGHPMNAHEAVSNLNVLIRTKMNNLLEIKRQKRVHEFYVEKYETALEELKEEREDLEYEEKGENSKRTKFFEELLGQRKTMLAGELGNIEKEEFEIKALQELVAESIAKENVK